MRNNFVQFNHRPRVREKTYLWIQHQLKLGNLSFSCFLEAALAFLQTEKWEHPAVRRLKLEGIEREQREFEEYRKRFSSREEHRRQEAIDRQRAFNLAGDQEPDCFGLTETHNAGPDDPDGADTN